MKSILVAAAIVVVLLLAGGGLYFYQRSDRQVDPVEQSASSGATTTSDTVHIPTLAPLVPTAMPTSTTPVLSTSSATASTSSGITTTSTASVTITTTKTGQTTMVIVSAKDPVSSSTQPAATTPAVQGSEYADAYGAVALRYNAIGQAMQTVQKTIVTINTQYAATGATAALNDLIKTGESQHTALVKANADFKVAINAFDVVNKKITNTTIQTKAQPIVTTGRTFAGSVDVYAAALTPLLAYRGIGDLNQLSATLTNATKDTNTAGSAFVREMLGFKTYLSQWQK